MIKEKQALRLRHELKYPIHVFEDVEICGRLKKIFSHDRNVNSHGVYHVSSLYFDTPYDKALKQKIDGVNYREKFRIRYYNKNLDYIRLEKKFKINGLCGKHSAKIDKKQVRSILNGEIDFLLHSQEPLFIELYNKIKGELLTPKIIVHYEREAFVYKPGNVRITIDRNLRSEGKVKHFLEEEQFFKMPVAPSETVLEVKYDAYLPDLVRMALQTTNLQMRAFSKYAICRRYD